MKWVFSAAQRREIGARVRSVRKTLKKTQSEIASAVSCTPPTIVELEKGGSFSERLLRDVAVALEVSEHWLLTGSNEPVEPLRSLRPDHLKAFGPEYRKPMIQRKQLISCTSLGDIERFILGASTEDVLKIQGLCVKELGRKIKGDRP